MVHGFSNVDDEDDSCHNVVHGVAEGPCTQSVCHGSQVWVEVASHLLELVSRHSLQVAKSSV